MNYFDEEFTQQLAAENIPSRVLLPAEEETLTHAIISHFPFSSGRIRWDAIPGSVHFENDGEANLKALSSLVKSTGAANVIFIGDSLTEIAYSINTKHIDAALKLFLEIPQHNYALPEDLSWIACMSMEGYMDFGAVISSIK